MQWKRRQERRPESRGPPRCGRASLGDVLSVEIRPARDDHPQAAAQTVIPSAFLERLVGMPGLYAGHALVPAGGNVRAQGRPAQPQGNGVGDHREASGSPDERGCLLKPETLARLVELHALADEAA